MQTNLFSQSVTILKLTHNSLPVRHPGAGLALYPVKGNHHTVYLVFAGFCFPRNVTVKIEYHGSNPKSKHRNI